MKIYSHDGTVLLDITPDDNSFRNRVVMGEHTLTLYYSLPYHLEIPVGAFCMYDDEIYILMRPEQLKMKHSRLYEYTVVFSAEQEKTKMWKFRNMVDGRLKFSLTAKPREHLQMLIDNLNRRDPGWVADEDCIDEVEKLINYDHDFCWDALGKIANEFETEFEIKGKQVSLKKVEYNKSNPLTLSYGKGKGFKPGIGRNNTGDSMPVEILYVQGGDRNIDRSKYPPADDAQHNLLKAVNNGCLLLPISQTLAYDGEHFEMEDGFNPEIARHYASDDLGLSIRNMDRELSTMAEDSLDRSDDYPKRVGRVSHIVEVDEKKNLYDFIDNSIPDDLNFEDYRIGDEKMTVIFQSGELAGKEFEVKYYHKQTTERGVTKAGRRFEIIPQEIDGVMMPGGSFLPIPGKDTYAVFHVMLPDQYIRHDQTKTGASWDMFKAAVRYLFDHEDKKFSFTGELDGIWAKRNREAVEGKIVPGGFISFYHESLAPQGARVRIISIKDYVNKPHSPKIELSNDTISPSFSSTIKHLESTEVVIEENHKAALQFTKRRFRDAKESIAMLESALSDNFSERISPVAVETMAMLVGDESLQFQFVEAPGATTALAHDISYDSLTRRLSAPAGTIQHLTLEIDSIRPAHTPNEYKYWKVAGLISDPLDNPEEKYYLYICANKYRVGVGTAEFKLEKKSHKLKEGNQYWLLTGILTSEYDGTRSFVPLYGFTEILPGRITADRLLSLDGESWFDMLNASMKLKDKLIFNKDGDGLLKLKGAIVQSQDGMTESPIGCFRGEYFTGTTYYSGDEVTYRADDSQPLSSYRCISSEPISGIPPTNAEYWKPTAAGVAGKAGRDAPVMVYRGDYDNIKTYYGNASRIDCVKKGDSYYVAMADAPEGSTGFTGMDPETEGSIYWRNFGASFESVATSLLLAENATIGNWFISGNNIVSTHGTVNGAESDNFLSPGFRPDVVLDGSTGELLLYSGKYPRVRLSNSSVSELFNSSLIKEANIQRYFIKDCNNLYIPVSHQTFGNTVGLVGIISLGHLNEDSQIKISNCSISLTVPTIAHSVAASVNASVEGSALQILIKKDGITRQTFAGSISASGSKGEVINLSLGNKSYTVPEGNEGNYSLEIHLTRIKFFASTSGQLSPVTIACQLSGSYIHGGFNKTVIGNDGIGSFWEDAAFVFSPTGLQVRFGNIGFKISEEGIKKTSSFNTNNPQWIDF